MPAGQSGVWAALLLCAALAASLPALAQSPSFVIVSPANGSVIRIRTVEIVASAPGAALNDVQFYAGNPGDGQPDIYLGAPDGGSNGAYTKTVRFNADGTFTVYAQAYAGSKIVSTPAVTFAIDTTTGIPAVIVSYPPDGSTLGFRTTTLCVDTAGFSPTGVELYSGDPTGGEIPVVLGEASRVADGQYALDYDFRRDGAFTLYATATDGARTAQSPLTRFTIDTTGKVPTTPRPGDLSGDGRISVQDATISLYLAVSNVQPTPAQIVEGDVNVDGRFDIRDTTIILQIAVGIRSPCL